MTLCRTASKLYVANAEEGIWFHVFVSNFLNFLLFSFAELLFNDCRVPILYEPPTPLQFYREYVAKNRPVLIKGAVGHWPAVAKWNVKYFRL